MRLFLFVLFSFSAQAQEMEITVENLSARWEFHDIKAKNMSAEEMAERKEMMEGISLTLNADGTCVTDFVMELEGKWTLDPEKKTLSTTDRRGTNTWHVHSLTQQTAVFSRNQTEFAIE